MDQTKSPIPNISTHRNSEFKIGILLIKSGKITSENARQVVEVSNEKGIRFGDAAVQLGLVTDADIDEVLAKQFDYTYLQERGDLSPHLVSAVFPDSVESEFVRGLRTQLSLSWFKGENKALAISSIESGSGNSRFVSNLAVAFSQLGKKTLIIDANLRKPVQQAIFFNNNTQRGLSDVLIGRAGLEAVAKVDGISKLSVLPAGAIPPNPQELIGGRVFKDLVTFFYEIFDVILIDTPAFSEGADAQVIGAAVGGVLLVTRKDVTKASKLTAVSKMLKGNGTEIVGSVMTDFKD